MPPLTDHRLTTIEGLARQRMTAGDRVTIELVAEVRRLRRVLADVRPEC